MMLVVKPFDPWRSPLCTCPPKYVVHPYTGCGHGCLYCYASSYIRDFYSPRPKKFSEVVFVKSLGRVPAGSVVELSTSSDPYTPPEGELRLTRGVVARVLTSGHRLLITTKSSLVLRDIDILAKYRNRVAVAVTITTLSHEIASLIEPSAPPPVERLKAVKMLSQAGIPTLVRLDPIIPLVNDNASDISKLVAEASKAGAVQITSSTYKARPDTLSRLSRAFPHIAAELRDVYRDGERVGGYLYMDRKKRLEYMKIVRETALATGLAFHTCREGFPELGSKGFSCDGSLLIGRFTSR
jgi:DNA repair photolyase